MDTRPSTLSSHWLGDLLTPWRDELARRSAGLDPGFQRHRRVAFRVPLPAAGAMAGDGCGRGLRLAAAVVRDGSLRPLRCLADLSLDRLGAGLRSGRAARSSRPIAVDARSLAKVGRWAVAFGVLAGCAAGTKFTGWLLPLPFLAWTVVYRSRSGLATLAVGVVVAAVTLYATTPPWWTAPSRGACRFFPIEPDPHRDHTAAGAVSGENPCHAHRLAALVQHARLDGDRHAHRVAGDGAGRCRFECSPGRSTGHAGDHQHGLSAGLAGHAHTPGHDGVRQFLPAFGCLALVAGLGAAPLINRFGRWGKLAVATALIEAALSIGLMMPFPLSYFSPIIGGLPGAARLGMEPPITGTR